METSMSSESDYLSLHYNLPKTYSPTQPSKILFYIVAILLAIILAFAVIALVNKDFATTIFLTFIVVVFGSGYYYFFSYTSTEGITLKRTGVTLIKRGHNIEIPAENIRGYNLSYIPGYKGGSYSMSLMYAHSNGTTTETTEFGWAPDGIRDAKFVGWLNSMRNYGGSDIEDLIKEIPYSKSKDSLRKPYLYSALGFILIYVSLTFVYGHLLDPSPSVREFQVTQEKTGHYHYETTRGRSSHTVTWVGDLKISCERFITCSGLVSCNEGDIVTARYALIGDGAVSKRAVALKISKAGDTIYSITPGEIIRKWDNSNNSLSFYMALFFSIFSTAVIFYKFGILK
jgi:hypothetical protein